MLSLVMKTFKALILLEKINLNYLVKDNKNVIKIVKRSKPLTEDPGWTYMQADITHITYESRR